MFNAQNAAASIFIGASIGTYDRVIRTDFWQRRLKEIAFSRLLCSLQDSRRMLSVGRTGGGRSCETARTCDCLGCIIADALIDPDRKRKCRLVMTEQLKNRFSHWRLQHRGPSEGFPRTVFETGNPVRASGVLGGERNGRKIWLHYEERKSHFSPPMASSKSNSPSRARHSTMREQPPSWCLQNPAKSRAGKPRNGVTPSR